MKRPPGTTPSHWRGGPLDCAAILAIKRSSSDERRVGRVGEGGFARAWGDGGNERSESTAPCS
eukprot:1043125-Prorocentrum_minimum.AAC.2